MNFLSIETLSKSFNEKELFNNISFGLSQGQKVGLVGINGSGKSTLLKIIMGSESPEEGKVVINKSIRIAYLEQQPAMNEDDTVLETVFNSTENDLIRLIKSYEEELIKFERLEGDQDRLNSLIEQIDDANAWDYESQVKQILGRLGIDNFDHKVGSLSGGQRKRVALAGALIENPDLLIIDEPTNHLDLEMIEWLENYLATQSLTLLLVTHDRYFLDKVTNEILELTQGTIRRYQGNYSYYLEKKLEIELQEKLEVEKAKNLMRKELDWMRRQPKARGTKAKYRVDAFYDLKDKSEKNLNEQEIQLNVKSTRQGKKVLELNKIGHGYNGVSLFQNFSYTFKKGDRIGIIGKNGMGKTTFLDIVTQQLVPNEGNLDVGQTTQFGYYTQHPIQFDPNQRVIDTVKEVAEVITMSDGHSITASQLLNLFLFPPKTQYNVVGKLSGGEKRRLQLLRILIKNPNFLILDEPTNDLDLQTLNVLEDFLQGFDGCVLLVSHDRYFMDKLVEHSFILEGNNEIRDFPGNYTDYRLEIKSKSSAKTKEKPASPPKSAQSTKDKTEKKKLSFKEQKEYEGLELEIEALENEKLLIINKMNAAGLNHQELKDLGDQIAEIEQQVETKTERWFALGEFI